MPSAIKEVFQLTADDTDLLAAPSRLAAIPYNGYLTVEVSATECNATNNFAITINKPDGSQPIEGQLVPANGFTTSDNVMHDDTKLMFRFSANQGGHFGIEMDETGTALAMVIVTLTPQR